MAKKNPSKEWSMPARVGVGAAVGYLLLGPVGGVGGAIAGSMYTLERNPGPGFLATGKQFGLNFPNGYSVAISWKSGEAFGRFADISVSKPNGELEGLSKGWGPGNMAKVILDTSRRSRTVRGVLGMSKPKAKTLQSLGVGVVSKGPNFSIIFENGWALRIDPEGPEPRVTSSKHYNFAPTATVFMYTPRGELVETIEKADPVSIARMLHTVATFKPKKKVQRRRKGNVLSPIKGELKGNPRTRKKSTAAAMKKECRRLWEHYCERPNKTRLKAVLKHCEKMGESSAKSVKQERARCLKSAKPEAKRLGIKL